MNGQAFDLDQHLAALMRATQAGDARAYARLLHEITPRLRQMVRRQRASANAADVEDLVQDVLLSLHTVRATYDPQRPFMPWLAAIARNRVVDGARRYARRQAREVPVDDVAVTLRDESANMDGEVFGDPGALRQAVQALPRAQREAVEMLKLRELSLKEAAAQSGASVGALKVSVHRAIAALRRALKDERT